MKFQKPGIWWMLSEQRSDCEQMGGAKGVSKDP
ncbi:MAG: hypothetical protein RLZZ435_1729 [Cyanobacteriota bacterium]|jgi:hypothetical protein